MDALFITPRAYCGTAGHPTFTSGNVAIASLIMFVYLFN